MPAASRIQKPSPHGRANFHPSPFFSRSVSDRSDVPRPCARGQAVRIFLATAFTTVRSRLGWTTSQPAFPRHLPLFGLGLAVVVRKLDMAEEFGASLLLDP